MKTIHKQILSAMVMLLGLAGVIALEYFGWPAVKIMVGLVVLLMTYEFVNAAWKKHKKIAIFGVVYLLGVLLPSALIVSNNPWILVLCLMIIVGTDTGAWFFGRKFGGDKMWESVSPNKTWIGQIAGIACGTIMGIMYGALGADAFFPQLMWIGISVALLSQYGDLTASALKRKFAIKDFGNIIPGHGGALDRFDGWLYVLPVVLLAMI